MECCRYIFSFFGKKSKQPQQKEELWKTLPPLESINVSIAEYKSSFFLQFCFLLNTITVLTAVFSGIVHFGIITFDPCNQLSQENFSHWLPNFIVRIYGILFDVIVIGEEVESSFTYYYFVSLFHPICLSLI